MRYLPHSLARGSEVRARGKLKWDRLYLMYCAAGIDTVPAQCRHGQHSAKFGADSVATGPGRGRPAERNRRKRSSVKRRRAAQIDRETVRRFRRAALRIRRQNDYKIGPRNNDWSRNKGLPRSRSDHANKAVALGLGCTRGVVSVSEQADTQNHEQAQKRERKTQRSSNGAQAAGQARKIHGDRYPGIARISQGLVRTNSQYTTALQTGPVDRRSAVWSSLSEAARRKALRSPSLTSRCRGSFPGRPF